MTVTGTIRSDERGVLTTEMAIIAVVFIFGFLGIVVFAGRVASAENDVRRAAHAAARSASLERKAGAAESAGIATAEANLSASGVSCAAGQIISVDVSTFGPRGSVTATVTCTAPFGDLGVLGVPGSRTFTYSATEVVDTYRTAS